MFVIRLFLTPDGSDGQSDIPEERWGRGVKLVISRQLVRTQISPAEGTVVDLNCESNSTEEQQGWDVELLDNFVIFIK